jgi:hypothetical protein
MSWQAGRRPSGSLMELDVETGLPGDFEDSKTLLL